MESLGNPSRTAELKRNHLIFGEARKIVIDYATASGGTLPTQENMEALEQNGYLSYSVQDILDACDCADIDDFHDFMRPCYEDDDANRQAHHEYIIESMMQGRQSGQLPDILFKRVERAKSDQKSLREVVEETTIRGKDLGIITDEDLAYDDEEMLKRYAKYLITKAFMSDSLDGPRPPLLMARENRRISIAMGVNIESWMVIGHSFTSELLGAAPDLDRADIEIMAMELHMFDYLYPENRTKYLESIMLAAQSPTPNVQSL